MTDQYVSIPLNQEERFQLDWWARVFSGPLGHETVRIDTRKAANLVRRLAAQHDRLHAKVKALGPLDERRRRTEDALELAGHDRHLTVEDAQRIGDEAEEAQVEWIAAMRELETP